jgi:DNA helicase-2/ATP-dependent DNA helicase PcrA
MARLPLSSVSTPEPAPPAFAYSPQQQAIMDAVKRPGPNLIIEARAGTGKTTTLIEVCKYLGRGAVFMAFNKNIATEIGPRLAAAGISQKDIKSATFHSVGFQAWVRHAPACRNNVRPEKLALLADKIGVPRQYQTFAKKLVSLAKQHLIGVQLSGGGGTPIDDDQAWLDLVEHFDLLDDIPQGDWNVDEEEFLEYGLAWSLKLLRQSIAESPTMIDYDDMIYMPLYSNLRFWQYEWVLIDEAQDTNLARREIAKRLLRPDGRLIAVGDRHQAIYGFTGASANALDLIEDEFQCDLLPLTVTYRCPQKVVRHAQQWVPDIEPRPDAPEGVVQDITMEQFKQIIPGPTDAILCRNTKPLVQLAFDYLRKHHACVIEGKDIGASLATLAKKWKSATTIAELFVWLEQYVESETEKLLGQHKEAQLATIVDKVETLYVLGNSVGLDQPVHALVDLINKLFKDTDGLAKQVTTLSTVHKAKGREWDRVFFIGRRQLIPSMYAKQEWQLEQEYNLAYVGVTRAKSELIEVELPR